MKLSWHATGTRVFETGVDRGVLYLSGQPGVPWNGLVSVSESKAGGDPKPFYVDGVKYLNLSTAEEYAATITAISAPDEFIACNGSASVLNGLFADQQIRKQFGFAYRSKMGNDTFGIEYGYKLHLVYNALAGSATRDYKTTSNTPEAMNLSWDITTIPEYLTGFKPTAHFIVDSTKTDPIVLGYLESILYGTAQLDPRLPTPTELKNMFDFVPDRPVPQPVNILGSIDPLLVQKITNRMTNPDWETAGSTVVVRSNYVTNPDFETAGSSVVLRTNRFPNPQNIGTPSSGRAPNWSAYSVGSPTGTYAVSGIIQQITTTAMAAGVGTERFGLGQIAYSLGSSVPSGSVINFGIDTSVVALPAGVRARVYVDVQDSTNGNATRGHWDSFFDATTGRLTGSATISGGTADTVRLYVWIENNNAGAAFSGTATVGVTRLVTEVNTSGPFFDGATAPVLRRNMIANPTPAVGSGTPARWTTNRPANGSVDVQANGEVVYTITTGGTGLTEGLVAQMVAGDSLAAPGFTYSGQIEVKAEGSLIGRNNPSSVILHDGTALATAGTFTYTGAWQTINVLATVAKTSSNLIGIYVYIPGALAGDIVRVRNPRIDFAALGTPVSGGFFNGSTVKSGYTYSWLSGAGNSTSIELDSDLPVRWQGTANNSPTEQYGTAPAGITGNIAGRFAIIQSTRYLFRGTKSARCIPLIGATGDEYIQIDIPAGVRTGGTAFANRYQEAAITIPGGSFAARALRTVIYTPETISSGLVNGPGWQEMRTVFPNLTSTYQMRLYHGGLFGSGDVWWDLAVLTEGNYSGPYFDGSSQPILATNLMINPNAVTATGFQNNNGATWVVNRNVAAPTGHPQGITTAASSILNGVQSTITLLSMYNIDGLTTLGPSRRIGAWFWVSAAGYQAKINSSDTPTPLSANQWTWVVGGVTSGPIYGGAFVEKQSGQGNAGTNDIAFVTGVTVYSDGTIPVRTVAGSVTPPSGFTVAWAGTVNSSVTTMWDSDFSTRWQSTANASVSELTGVQPAGIKAANAVRAIQSTRWVLSGSKSVRLIAIGTSTDSFVSVDIPAIARNITLTSIATSYMEVGVASGTGNVPRVRTVLPDFNGGLRTPGLVGTQEQRLTSSVTTSPWELRLMHGGISGSPDVWWDLSAIIDADYSGPSFDGDTPMFVYKNVESTPVWDGAANASTSHIEYYNEFLNPANQGDAYIIGSNLWVYNAGAWGNYGAIPLLTGGFGNRPFGHSSFGH